MELECEFRTMFEYTCRITSANITEPDTRIKTIQGKHENGKTNDDVQVIWFIDTVVNFISRGLTVIFPNLNRLDIKNCGLKEICRKDLVGFENLEYLRIDFNKLTSLPDDLFVNTPKLKNISFIANEIESMSSNLFKPIINNKFECINFRSNTKISTFYMPGYSGSVSSVAELMRIIDAQCSKPKSIETSQVIQEPDKILQNYSTTRQGNLIKSLEKLFDTGNFSDFVIIVNKQKKFKVHKIILASQSEGFTAMFQNDPTATEMKIEDLSSEAVEEFLRYLYTGILPKNNEKSMEIFALASTLKVAELKNAIEKQILISLDKKNAWKIFSLAHKYDSDELKIAAFKEIQKMFPDRNLPDEMAGNFPMLQEIMEFKVKMDAIFGKVSELKI